MKFPGGRKEFQSITRGRTGFPSLLVRLASGLCFLDIVAAPIAHCQHICANSRKNKPPENHSWILYVQFQTAFVGQFTLSSMVFDRSEFPLLLKLGLYAKNTAGNGLIPLSPNAGAVIDCHQ